MLSFRRLAPLVVLAAPIACALSCSRTHDESPTPAPFGLDARPPRTGCGPFARPPSASELALEPAFVGLTASAPISMTPVPGSPGEYFLAERAGRVLRFSRSSPSSAKVVIDLSTRVNAAGEGGLLGIAPHPRFTENGFLYLSYTTQGGPAGLRSTVTRVRSTDGGATFGDEMAIIAPFDQPYSNHNGGHIAFGIDGYLYVGFGDGGAGGDPLGNGQKKDGLFSKILRLDVDGGSPYAIPDGNPFKNGGGAPEAFAYGFRNPWRFAFDRETGELWVGDVGQNAWEEIDLVHAGGNYGWNAREGTHCYTESTCNAGAFEDPIWEYGHDQGNSITGGTVYRGSALPSLVGSYVFADFGGGAIWRLSRTPTVTASRINPVGPNGNWVHIAEDENGELYFLDIGGTIYALVATPPPGPGSPPPELLSQTGCVDTIDRTRPSASMIPYDVRSPLWSDGADKERAFVVPDGTTIRVSDDGDFDLPVGSVVMKTFRLGGLPVETRLLVRHDDDWAGYTYEWRDDGDAHLLPDERKLVVKNGSRTWSYPSRRDCMECHTRAAGRTLGLEAGQLDGDGVYAATNRISNQLDTLLHVGVVDESIRAQRGRALPRPSDVSSPLESRVRSHLHSNCSFCHRPGGPGRGSLDLRFSTSFPATGLCNEPSTGDLGRPGARIVTPRDSSRSLLLVRMRAFDDKRMPPLATTYVDVDATSLIERWIGTLSTCP